MFSLVMIMKKYSIFAKASGLEPHHQMVWYHIQETRWEGGSYPFEGMSLVYSTALAGWAALVLWFNVVKRFLLFYN